MIQKILFLNLPNKARVQRRYMCSYNAPNMLFPPIEMLYLAAIAREWHGKEVFLIDAIAEELNFQQVSVKIKAVNPDMIVSITGFEIYEEDIKQVIALREEFDDIQITLFGHYASLFAKETFKHVKINFILEGEPDLNFSNLLSYLDNECALDDFNGVFFKKEGNIYLNKGKGRLKKPDVLPLPAHDLLKFEAYSELFLPKPFGLIQTARGCPYSCNFCVRSYGKKLSVRSADNIIKELELLKDKHHIKSFRFIDDTFTATPKRVKEICQQMIDRKLNLVWTCLSRADTLTEEVIGLMKKAGCIRVYIGIESGSEKVLDNMNKRIDLDSALSHIHLIHKYGMQTNGFFMVGHPSETEEDFKQSVSFAIKAKFDFIIVSEFIPYPGTVAANTFKEGVNFSLFPYHNEFKDSSIKAVARKRIKRFYKEYYFRPIYFIRSSKIILGSPLRILNLLKSFFSFLFSNKSEQKARKDFI